MILEDNYSMVAGQSPDALVQEYTPLVRRIANRLRGRLPDSVDREDLIQVGLMALLEAARQYSPARGATFQTYAGIRVRGAMLDEVRSSGWTPRAVYRRQRDLTAAIQAVENQTGKPADARGIAAQMGLSLEAYFQMVASAAAHRVFSLDHEGEDGGMSVYQIQDPQAEPCAELQSEEIREAVIDAIRALPERDALVMSLYYDEKLNLKEIGNVLGVTESRVCQIHAQALARVRAHVTELVAGSASMAT